MGLEGARKRRAGRLRCLCPGGPGEARASGTVCLVIACLTLAALVFVSGAYKGPLEFIAGAFRGYSEDDDDVAMTNGTRYGPSDVPRDKYLGGLLAADFDEQSCLSRYQSTMYRKPSQHKPSPYLVQRLRKYEEHHRRCGPNTASYNRALQILDSGSAPENETECKYILWKELGGVGNRILTLASTFLYALLTDRIVLIDRGRDMTDLFCEPFLATTWLLPQEFPISNLGAFHKAHHQSYGNLLKKNKISNDVGAGAASQPLPAFVYLHLKGDYTTEDMYFFCEPDQLVLRRVPWLLLKSDNYFVPGLFLNQVFEPELARLFPEKETVFHHLGRYLFHPTNEVWETITRYYRAHLATSREILGIQIRIFSYSDAPFKVVSEQVLNCTLREKLLPDVVLDERNTSAMADPNNTKAVLLTSLHSGYSTKIRNTYREHPAVNGTVVRVHQPSHEASQWKDNANHEKKAWAEIYLLSLADVLVTSAWSTFGYAAQGLAGIKPWILPRPENAVMPEPTCVRDTSMEPCFHSSPWYVCRVKKNGDNSKVLPFVTQCRDTSGGLKLVDPTQ